HAPAPITIPVLYKTPSTAPIYTLSLHDALPISQNCDLVRSGAQALAPLPTRSRYSRNDYASLLVALSPRSVIRTAPTTGPGNAADRKSTRLNSSHLGISYAVFCLKKKRKKLLTCLPCRAHAARSRIADNAATTASNSIADSTTSPLTSSSTLPPRENHSIYLSTSL